MRSKDDLQRSEYILSGAGLGSWDWWLATNEVTFDRRWCEMLGLRFEETPQHLSTWDSRVHPDDLAKAYDDIKAYFAGKTEVYENIHRMRHADGHWVWILDRGRISEYDAEGKPFRFTGTHLEITDYKEEQLLFEETQRMAKIGGWELIAETGRTVWTPETYRIHGVPVITPTDRIMGIDFYAPHERSRIGRYVNECLKGKAFHDVFEFTDANHNRKWVEVLGRPITDAAGKVYKILGTFQDVTEKIEIRRNLEEAELAGGIGSFTLNLKTNQSIWSKGHNVLFEFPENVKPEFALFLSKLHPDDRHLPLAVIDEARARGAPNFRIKYRVELRDGGYRFIEGKGTITYDRDGAPELIRGFVQDVTETTILNQKLEEERLVSIHSAKLASLGEMAAGMAHEINNPLAIIIGKLAFLRDFKDDEEKFSAHVAAIGKSLGRIEKIVKGLSMFSRTTALNEFKHEALAGIVAESLALIQPKADRFLTPITVDVDPELRIFCDAIEIEQVLVNLLSNAIDAVKARAERWVTVRAFADGDAVVLQVIDAGPGLGPELERKIFQPFFTTKEVGEGTGLGLSIAKGILDYHQADLRVNRSLPSTCFEVRFPKPPRAAG
jgi:PAS domain S-box-containing protein